MNDNENGKVVNICLAADCGQKLSSNLKIERTELYLFRHFLIICFLLFFDKFGMNFIFLGSNISNYATSLVRICLIENIFMSLRISPCKSLSLDVGPRYRHVRTPVNYGKDSAWRRVGVRRIIGGRGAQERWHVTKRAIDRIDFRGPSA